jgi:prophage regulatory protein
MSSLTSEQPDPLAGFPFTGFVREKDLLRFIPVDRSTIWRWVASGTFPSPQKLSDGVTAWSAAAVRAHFAARSRGVAA